MRESVLNNLIILLSALSLLPLHANSNDVKQAQSSHLSSDFLKSNYLKCSKDSSGENWTCDEYDSESHTPIQRSALQGPLSELDWVQKDYLNEAQKQHLAAGCSGMYVDRSRSLDTLNADQATELDEIPLVIEAEKSALHQGQTAVLEGTVRVSQGGRSITAEKMTFDRSNNEAILEENVAIRQPGVLIRGDKAAIRTDQNQAKFSDAIFVLHNQHIRGSATSIEQQSSDIIVLENGRVTSCEPGSNAWQLVGKELRINRKTQQGSGKNIQFKLGPVPVLYFPYITFPVGDARQSGFLAPSFGSSDDGGLDIAIPYYWNIAPNYDMTIAPRLVSGRGAMLELESRHLNRWFLSQLNLAYLPDDKGGQDQDIEDLIDNGILVETEAKPHKGSDRWLAQFNQVGGHQAPWYTEIDFTKASDRDYLRDLGTSSFSTQNKTHLNQSFNAGYYFSNWHTNVLVQNYQVLLLNLDRPYRRLPQIDVDGRYQWSGLGVSLEHEYTHFDHDVERWLDNRLVLTGQRLVTDYRANWNGSTSWGFFKPEVGIKTLNYALDDSVLSDDAEANVSLTAPQLSLDSGLVFERFGDNFSQTFEPRAYYLYRDFQDHSELIGVTTDGQDVNFDTSERTFSYSQLYRDSRFSGKDRLDDANRLTLGFTSRWISNTSGRERLNIRAGQTFYFDDRKVSLNSTTDSADYSEIAVEAEASLGRSMQLYGSAIYDTGTDDVTRGTAGISYMSSDYQRIVNLAYAYAANYTEGTEQAVEIDQVDFSWVWPLSSKWHMIGRYNYDFTQSQELETFFGFEYKSCCYRIRLLAREWLDSNIATLVDSKEPSYDRGLFFEFYFKGLGGAGEKVSSILGDSIQGFNEREKQINK